MRYPVSDPTARLNGGKFADADPAKGVLGSIDKARDMVAVYDEIIAVIVAGGIVPAEADLTQLREAIGRLINSGVANGIAGLRNGVGIAMDTLIEISASLGHNNNFAGLMTSQLAGKSAVGHTHWTVSNASPGVAKHNDSGLMIQWGVTAAIPAGSTGGVTYFANGFPFRCYALVAVYTNSATPGVALACNIADMPIFSPAWFRLTHNGSGGAQFSYIAVGF